MASQWKSQFDDSEETTDNEWKQEPQVSRLHETKPKTSQTTSFSICNFSNRVLIIAIRVTGTIIQYLAVNLLKNVNSNENGEYDTDDTLICSTIICMIY